jgi:hypothetical protein
VGSTPTFGSNFLTFSDNDLRKTRTPIVVIYDWRSSFCRTAFPQSFGEHTCGKKERNCRSIRRARGFAILDVVTFGKPLECDQYFHRGESIRTLRRCDRATNSKPFANYAVVSALDFGRMAPIRQYGSLAALMPKRYVPVWRFAKNAAVPTLGR